MIKNDPHIFAGMRRDTSISKQDPKYLFDAHNIRFTARNGDTQMSMTNERGPKRILRLKGTYLGHCTIGKYLTVFTHSTYSRDDKPDRIYRVEFNVAVPDFTPTPTFNTGNPRLLFEGNLGFDTHYPISTLGFYELENLQKVYWIDGKNQPRVINIRKPELDNTPYVGENDFNFIKELQLAEEISVSRGSMIGSFPGGVIQYCVTYSNLYGSETNIAKTTPLYGITFADRGASPEETVGTSFNIKIDNVDHNFGYLHLYSIVRTSVDGQPVVRLVDKVLIQNGIDTIDIVDTNHGESVDPTYLLYVGGEDIRPYCFAQKDNTAFFGNYTQSRRSLNTDFKNYLVATTAPTLDPTETPAELSIVNSKSGTSSITLSSSERYTVFNTKAYETASLKEYTNYIGALGTRLVTPTISPSMSAENVSPYLTPSNYLRGNEFYRLGLQFQHKTGKWSEPVWIGDVKTKDVHPVISDLRISSTLSGEDNLFTLEALPEILAELSLTSTQLNYLKNNKYVQVRPLVVFPKETESNILCQGVLMPTVYSEKFRKEGMPYAQSSWFIRPFYDPSAPTAAPTITPSPQLSKTKQFAFEKPLRDKTAYSSDQHYMFMTGEKYYKDQEIEDNKLSQQQSDPEGRSVITLEDFLDNEYLVENGALLEFRHNEPLKPMTDRGGELEFSPFTTLNTYGAYDFYYHSVGSSHHFRMPFTSTYGRFFVDQNILTLYSPDLVFDDTFFNSSYSKDQYSLRVVGKSIYTMNVGGMSLQTSSAKAISNASGFKKLHFNAKGFQARRSMCSGLFYEDSLIDTKNNEIGFPYDCTQDAGSPTAEAGDPVLFMVYPWQKAGSLNNDANRANGSTRTSVLLKKCLYNFKYSNGNLYSNINNVEYELKALQYFNSDQLSLLRLDNGHSYYGNVDTVISTEMRVGKMFTLGDNASTYDNRIGKSVSGLSPLKPFSSYTYLGLELFNESSPDPQDDSSATYWVPYGCFTNMAASYSPIDGSPGNKATSLRVNKEPIRMKYKTTPHMVMSLAGSDSFNHLTYTPTLNESNETLDNGYSYIGELYRTDAAETYSALFGGTSTEAFENNIWLVAGETVPIPTAIPTGADSASVTIKYSYGDTWFQRYDCLKTYPFTFEDENQIIEIASFMVETKTNLDGRYDKNRGPAENFSLSPTNFNLVNPVYSQKDNFFTYRILPNVYYQNEAFPTTFFWTKEKTPGEEVDTWTNLTLASTHLMDGTNGPLNRLVTWNDHIYAFQDKAISEIMFNSRVQIPVSDGVPIEISNSYKLDGTKTISNTMGCNNPWEVAVTEAGVYFRDSVSKDLCAIGNSMISLGTSKGFGFWFKEQKSIPWIVQFYYNSGKLMADALYKDLYFVCDNTALVYSELLGEFTSFMSYGKMVGLCNINNRTYCFTTNTNSSQEAQATGTSLYIMEYGEYNKFFEDNYEPFDFTFISNAESALDKTFTNIETRVDFYEGTDPGIGPTPTPTTTPSPTYTPTDVPTEYPAWNTMSDKTSPITGNNLLTTKFFDQVRITNEYQDTGEMPLTLKNARLSTNNADILRRGNLTKNFRIWRVGVPRDATSKYGRDRIRNPWCKIQFKSIPTDSGNYSMELHDINVQYDT